MYRTTFVFVSIFMKKMRQRRNSPYSLNLRMNHKSRDNTGIPWFKFDVKCTWSKCTWRQRIKDEVFKNKMTLPQIISWNFSHRHNGQMLLSPSHDAKGHKFCMTLNIRLVKFHKNVIWSKLKEWERIFRV